MVGNAQKDTKSRFAVSFDVKSFQRGWSQRLSVVLSVRLYVLKTSWLSARRKIRRLRLGLERRPTDFQNNAPTFVMNT
jgi:hypothetical protein